jgi:toxin ParE1/3/4
VRIVWAPVALFRVEQIARRIAEGRQDAARAWVIGLFDAVSSLSDFPERGRMVPEAGRPDIREVLYRDHRVIYRLESRRVAILTVRHARRMFDSREIPRD